MMDTRAVVERYFSALAQGDIDALSETFSDAIVFVTPERRLCGRAAMTQECRQNLDGVFAPGTYQRVLDAMEVEGEVALVMWHADCLGTRYTDAVTTFVVRDGHIEAISLVAPAEPV